MFFSIWSTKIMINRKNKYFFNNRSTKLNQFKCYKSLVWKSLYENMDCMLITWSQLQLSFKRRKLTKILIFLYLLNSFNKVLWYLNRLCQNKYNLCIKNLVRLSVLRKESGNYWRRFGKQFKTIETYLTPITFKPKFLATWRRWGTSSMSHPNFNPSRQMALLSSTLMRMTSWAFGWRIFTLCSSISLSKVIMSTPTFAACLMKDRVLHGFA